MKKFNKYLSIYKYIEPLEDDDKDFELRNSISLLYLYLEKYLNISSVQLQRSLEDDKKIKKLTNIKHNKNLSKFLDLFFADIHFLLISMEKCYKMVIKLFGLLNNTQKVKQIITDTEYINTKYIRNQLEHMDEKLSQTIDESQKHYFPLFKRKANWFHQQFRLMINNKITLTDKNKKTYTFELNENCMDKLIYYYEEINKLIENKYTLPNKDYVDKIL